MTTALLERPLAPVAPPARKEEVQYLRDVQGALSGAFIRKDTPCLIGPDGRKFQLPEPLFRILLQAIPILLTGDRVQIAPVQKELTTQEAADLLNVSRPYLVRLLNDGKIAFHRVGTHRRVKFGDVMRYKAAQFEARKKELQNIIELSEELDLYDEE
jgi:excisionase family DNA binding protein